MPPPPLPARPWNADASPWPSPPVASSSASEQPSPSPPGTTRSSPPARSRAGEFDLQGSTDGAAFSNSPEAPGKTLTFALDADALSPGDVVYAPFAVQLSADSDYAADVALANTIDGLIGEDLTFSLHPVATFGATCSAAAPPASTALVTDRAADAAGSVDALDLTAAATPTNLCFVVTAGDDLAQGATGTITWEFIGTSTDPLP